MQKFEKVSFEQFKKDVVSEFYFDEDVAVDSYEAVTLPRRQTTDSAGYDFVSPIGFTLRPNEEIKVPTGIKCSLNTMRFLLLAPRSGQGFKYYVRLANTIGVGDKDYYNNKENEGHYWVKIRNEGEKDMTVKRGERFCQGIILPFELTDDDNPVNQERNGGHGSTGVN